MEVPERPLYIDATCDRCVSFLVLADSLDPMNDPEDYWLDEWACPTCPEVIIYLDWPKEEVDRLRQSINDSEFAAVVGEKRRCGCTYVDGRRELTSWMCKLHSLRYRWVWLDVWQKVFK